MSIPLSFACPRCKQNFEFDLVGEYELVPCPICGTEFVTVRKGQRMLLEALEFDWETQNLNGATRLTLELPC